MPVTVSANGLTVVHQGSSGIATATVPDVCKTPSSGGPIPIPYPNIAMSSDLMGGTTTITVDGMPAMIQGSKFFKSTGDEPGVVGGVVSSVFIGEASPISFSPNVFFEGKPVIRLTDKMLMNKGNTVCAAGVLQAPSAPSAPMQASSPGSAVDHPDDPSKNVSQQPKAAKRCTISEFAVKCSHGARNFKVDALKTPGATLQILSGKDPDPVIFSLVGTCGVHQGSTSECPWIEVRDKDYNLLGKKGDPKVEFPRPGGNLFRELADDVTGGGRDHTGEVGFLDKQLFWIRYVFSFDAIPTDFYEVRAYSCGGGGETALLATSPMWIQVFPNFSWKGDLSLGYEYEKESSKPGEPPSNNLEPVGYFGFSVDFEVSYYRSTKKINFTLNAKGAHKDDFGPMSSGPFALAQSFINLFGGKFQHLDRFTKSRGASRLCGQPGDRIEIKWPKIQFGGGTELAEKEKSPVVYRKGECHFKFSPLIGFEVSTDLLEWLIRIAATAIPGGGVVLAKFLLKAKHWAAGDLEPPDPNAPKAKWYKPKAKAVVEIRLTVGGEIGGGFGWTFGTGLSPDQNFLEAKVGFSLVGRVYGEIRVWKVQASACAEISAKSKDGTEHCGIIGSIGPKKGKSGFATSGQIKFTGLAIHYLMYYEYGSAGSEAGPKVPNGKDFGAHFSKDSKTRKEKKNCLAVLFDEHTWKVF